MRRSALYVLAAATLLLTACSSSTEPPKNPPSVEIRRAEFEPGADLTAVVSRNGRTVYVHDSVDFTGHDFADASIGEDTLGRLTVRLKLTDEAAARLKAVTGAHIDRPVAIMVRGELVSAPIVVSQLSHEVMIMGLSVEEVDELVGEFRGGS